MSEPSRSPGQPSIPSRMAGALRQQLSGNDRAANAVCGADRLQRAPAQHKVHVREHLAKRKAHLVRIKLACENEGDQFGRRSGLRPASAQDLIAARVMVGNQRIDAGMQSIERQVVPGKHKDVAIDAAADRIQRPQILSKRITFRIDRRHADIRGNLGQHLVGGKEQLVGAAAPA